MVASFQNEKHAYASGNKAGALAMSMPNGFIGTVVKTSGEFAAQQQILAFGWRCRPLGLPQHRDGALLAALRIDIDAQTPALLRAAGLVSSAALAGGDLRAAA